MCIIFYLQVLLSSFELAQSPFLQLLLHKLAIFYKLLVM